MQKIRQCPPGAWVPGGSQVFPPACSPGCPRSWLQVWRVSKGVPISSRGARGTRQRAHRPVRCCRATSLVPFAHKLVESWTSGRVTPWRPVAPPSENCPLTPSFCLTPWASARPQWGLGLSGLSPRRTVCVGRGPRFPSPPGILSLFPGRPGPAALGTLHPSQPSLSRCQAAPPKPQTPSGSVGTSAILPLGSCYPRSGGTKPPHLFSICGMKGSAVRDPEGGICLWGVSMHILYSSLGGDPFEDGWMVGENFTAPAKARDPEKCGAAGPLPQLEAQRPARALADLCAPSGSCRRERR